MKESTKKKLDSIDKSKIKVQESKDLLAKIEKALNNDKNEENQAKAEKLLDVFIAKAKAKNADIFKTEEPAKPKTPAQKKQVAQATKSKLDSLMDTIANDPLFKDFNSARRSKGGGKSDPLIDSERKARESGRRVSQKGWSNQYGKSKGGRRYYEYRENRIDRKAPTYGAKPWLEDGGLIHPSDKFQEKYSVIEIKGDGSRRVHNTFPDFETAMVFASLKRNVMPSNTRIVVEDEKGTTMYRSFKSGGEVDESTAMVLSQNKAIAHHTKELKNAISKNEKVEPWVIGKMQRASTDMSDVTHYFDGMTEYAKGGYMADGGQLTEEDYNNAFESKGYLDAEDFAKIDSTIEAKYLDRDRKSGVHDKFTKWWYNGGSKIAMAKYGNNEIEAWENAYEDFKDDYYKMAKGGKIVDQYDGRTPEDIWNNLTKSQRQHFLYDHRDIIEAYRGDEELKNKEIIEAYNSDWKGLDKDIKNRFANHTREGEYAKGGYMADGGETSNRYFLSEEDDDGFYYIMDSQTMKKAPNTIFEREDVKGWGKIKNKFVKTRQRYVRQLTTRDAKHIIMILNDDNFAKGGYMADRGKVKWQDVFVGDKALVIEENKMGYVIKPYGRRFHLKFPDGSEKTYSAEELEFFKDEEYAKGGKTPTGDYTNRRNLHLIVIKNPNKNGSKNYLTIDKRDFLNGLHKFEEGGNLSKEYTYIKRADVNQVVYRDSNNKETIDFKPKNGFWVSKKALVDAGMNETKSEPKKLDFGTTSMRKTSSGWIAKNKLSDYMGYDWEITTMKSMRGDLVSTAVGGKNEKSSSGYTMFTYVMYQDPNVRLITSKPSRITEKVTLEQQEKALKEFETKVTDKWYAKGGKIGFEGLSNKVAKNYEGKKVAPKYQDEYGKTYDKKEAKEVGNKVASKVYRQQLAKMEHGGELPEDLGKYFIKTRSTKVIPMSNIIPLRARAEGIANAEKYMKMAYDGKMDKRKPITLYKSQGKYRVYDGNSTYAVAKANGWENIWAEVIKNPNMNTKEKRGVDIFTKAKQIRKEGEAWKDALQRAKAMK